MGGSVMIAFRMSGSSKRGLRDLVYFLLGVLVGVVLTKQFWP